MLGEALAALTKAQRDKVTNFQAVTGAPPKLATDFLKRYNWSLDQAVDTFFTEGHTFPSKAVSSVDPRKLDAFFRKYKDAEEDAVRESGIQELCGDLGVDPLDPVTLVLSYHCCARQMGVFTREEFTGGMQRLGCDDIQKLRAKLDDLRVALQDRNACKEVYAFTFGFALDTGMRCLPVEVCVELWKLLLRGHFGLLDTWITFVEQKVKNAISKDTWMMLYDLATQVRPDLSDYDVNGAWPVVIDEFVEFARSNATKS